MNKTEALTNVVSVIQTLATATPVAKALFLDNPQWAEPGFLQALPNSPAILAGGTVLLAAAAIAGREAMNKAIGYDPHAPDKSKETVIFRG